jgi:hypothetical protein
MVKLITATLIASSVIAVAAASAQAAGGNGASYCSNASAPDGEIVVDDLTTYDNPGEFVSALSPWPGDKGVGWNVQSVCNPNRFVP